MRVQFSNLGVLGRKQIHLRSGFIKKTQLVRTFTFRKLIARLIVVAYRVTSLPDVPFNVGEMYSGLIPVKVDDTSRQLFFVYQPKIAGPPVDEITIWMNGGEAQLEYPCIPKPIIHILGPGCSSLEGFFQENGRVSRRHFETC